MYGPVSSFVFVKQSCGQLNEVPARVFLIVYFWLKIKNTFAPKKRSSSKLRALFCIVRIKSVRLVLKDGFGETVVKYDMPEPYKVPSLDKK